MFKVYQGYGIDTEVQRDSGDTLIHSADGAVIKVPFGQLPVCHFVCQMLCALVLTESFAG